MLPAMGVEQWPGGRRWKNVVLLSAAWACTATGLFLNVSSTTEASRIVHSDALSTLPVALFVMAAFFSVVPLARLSREHGRRAIYIPCAALAAVGAACSAVAAATQSFVLLCLGTVLQGFGFAVGNQLRFVATEFVSPASKPTAVAVVILGGFVASAGPEVGRLLRFAHPDGEFIASYLCLVCLYALQCVLLWAVELPALERQPAQAKAKAESESEEGEEGVALEAKSTPRGDAAATPAAGNVSREVAPAPPAPPLRAFLLSRKYAVPASAGALSFAIMASLMAATPLAMIHASHSFRQSVVAVTCHVLGMYLPALAAPHLTRLVGARALMVVGFTVLTGGGCLFLASTAVGVFVAATTLVGVGWALSYVAASSLIAAATLPAHARIVQAVTDMMVFGLVSVGLVCAGLLFAALGPTGFFVLWSAAAAAALLLSVHHAATATGAQSDERAKQAVHPGAKGGAGKALHAADEV